MANQRKMKPEELEGLVRAYFDSISYEEPLMVRKPVLTENEKGQYVPAMDVYGHEKYIYEPVKRKDGTPVMKTVWTESPSVIGLSLFIGVDRSTLYRWKENPGKGTLTTSEKRICNILTHAWGRIEAYLTAKVEDGKAARGAIANLEANFGWKRRREVGLDAETAQVIEKTAEMTMGQKLALLTEMGLRLPGTEVEPGERTEEDDE